MLPVVMTFFLWYHPTLILLFLRHLFLRYPLLFLYVFLWYPPIRMPLFFWCPPSMRLLVLCNLHTPMPVSLIFCLCLFDTSYSDVSLSYTFLFLCLSLSDTYYYYASISDTAYSDASLSLMPNSLSETLLFQCSSFSLISFFSDTLWHWCLFLFYPPILMPLYLQHPSIRCVFLLYSLLMPLILWYRLF